MNFLNGKEELERFSDMASCVELKTKIIRNERIYRLLRKKN